ncbi:YfhO family protein [Kribbella jejuensis]|uniref:Membrane protein YfhO n=1 Tax=Kribbella jejuensis TaxID=236068 RepID=A0A542ELN3_9ACTN|nr:YfhO family protein [Kribbella jejuensis]TQJ16249.1 membrane protein YfhO [Kribbella jejuensis]
MRADDVSRGVAARLRRQWPPLAAAVAAGLTFVVSGIIRHTYPFGDGPRSTNDLGQQVIPMYAHYRDILTGHGGDLFFNWSSGLGVPFLGDFMAYVGSTLSWITVIFPRDRVDLVLFLVDVLAIALAAGAMTAYLRYLRPGPAWLAVVAGMSYGACGWAIDDAAYMSVWLNGLVAFPVICLLCEWILRRRSTAALMVTPLVVALLWTSHFYTVYMATIGAAIVVVTRLLGYGATVSWRHRLTGAVRCIVAVGLGIALAAPLLLPTFDAVRAARPSPDAVFRPIGSLVFLARLMPGSEGVGTTPGLAVGTVVLLLALSFPFNRQVPARERIAWTATVVLTMLSLQIPITHEIWHGFDTPNGSPYRQAFIVAGMLVIVGWMSAAAGVRTVLTAVAPVGAVLLLYVETWHVRSTTTVSHRAVPVLVVLAVGVWLASRSPSWVRRGAVAVLVVAVFAEVSVSSAAIDARRSKILSAKAPWGDEHTALRSLVESAADWPTYRTAPGAQQTVNDPMLIGGQGPQYYSSTMPDLVSRQLLSLGFGYSSYGRATVDPRNPVVDAVFAVRSRVVVPPSGNARLERSDVPPLVTVRPATAWVSGDPGPFGTQESALGADVYTVPKVRGGRDRAVNVSDRRGTLTVAPAPGAGRPVEARLLASCTPGSEIWFAAPDFVGAVMVAGRGWVTNLPSAVKSPGLYAGAPMLRVGTVGAEGVAAVLIRVSTRTDLPAAPIGCLHPERLDAAVRSLSPADGPAVKVTGHGLTIRLRPSGTANSVVLGMIWIDGWRCSVDGGAGRTPDNRAGLIAIPTPAGASDVSCSYHPPGLGQGLAIGAAAALCLLLLGAVLALGGALLTPSWRGARARRPRPRA